MSRHRRRGGIEGTLSQGVRAMHLRRACHVALAKTHLQHALAAAAINLSHIDDRLSGTPRARTRRSAFVRLMARPAWAFRFCQQYPNRGFETWAEVEHAVRRATCTTYTNGHLLRLERG